MFRTCAGYNCNGLTANTYLVQTTFFSAFDFVSNICGERVLNMTIKSSGYAVIAQHSKRIAD